MASPGARAHCVMAAEVQTLGPGQYRKPAPGDAVGEARVPVRNGTEAAAEGRGCG